MVVLVGVVVGMVLPIREPNVGGIGNRRRRNPYTANHNALPMCQAIPTETKVRYKLLSSTHLLNRQYQFCFGLFSLCYQTPKTIYTRSK